MPQADAAGLLADGWLSSAIARAGSPGAHAAQHKHGGSDEVATVTPAAYAIPKATSGGTLADGWLSTAIARTSQIPTTLPPSGAADGDLYNNYPAPNVKAIHGFEFEDPNPGAPDLGAVYVYDDGWPGWLLSDVTGIKGVQELAGIYKVPMAGGTGKIDDGWLNTTIARVSQLTWANITGKPTTLSGFGITDGVQNAGAAPSVQTGADASKPAAGTAGRLYVASDTARIYRDSGSAWVLMGVVGWGDVTGKPATFTPASHAASHQNGGADEIATATPAANAIPKANASGDLADGWLSTNVPLKNTANTFTLAQTVTITDANTATPVGALILSHALSSGSAAAGFGVDVAVNGHTTAGTNRNMSLIRTTWVNAADASRTGRILFYAYDMVQRRQEALRPLNTSKTCGFTTLMGVPAA